MDTRAEIGAFLRTRRARLSPEQAQVPLYTGTRRVPGLRREEVAHLAGVSTDYYTRLERGKVSGVSAEVLDAVARALQLDEDEHQHLMDLVRAARPRSASPRTSRRNKSQQLRPTLQIVVDAISLPAFIQNGRHDVLATNGLGRALWSLPHNGAPFNHARYVFLDPRAREVVADWPLTAHNNVALLRAAAAKDPHDEDLIRLVGELCTQSQEFGALWASHDVLTYRYGPKRFHHPLVGDLQFGYESFDLPAEPGLVLLVYTAEVGSPTHDALQLLASWTTLDAPTRVGDTADRRPADP